MTRIRANERRQADGSCQSRVAIVYSRVFASFAVTNRRLVGLCLLLPIAVALLSGCEEEKQKPAKPKPPAASVTLRVVVANDPQLAGAIRRLSGEWAERSGGEMRVIDAAADPLAEDFPAADLVIFASRKLGELCEADYLRPMRQSTLKSEVLDFDDIYPLVREQEIVYGNRVMALPLGTPVPLLGLNSEDVVESWDDVPTPTDVSYGSPKHRAYGDYFLMRVSSSATHPARLGVLFNGETMKPLLDQPPAVAAMESVASSIYHRGDKRDWRSVVLLPAFNMSLGFSPEEKDEQDRRAARVAAIMERNSGMVAPLPGSKRIYDPVSRQWQQSGESILRVTFLGSRGRLLGVTRTSRNAASAFRLAAWLGGRENARTLSVASWNVAACRRSLASDPSYGPPLINTEREDFAVVPATTAARAQATSLRNTRSFMVPRLIRVDDYLEALSQGAQNVAEGSQSPEQALASVAAEWEALTEAVGRDRQRRAYRRHLGLEDYEPGSVGRR